MAQFNPSLKITTNRDNYVDKIREEERKKILEEIEKEKLAQEIAAIEKERLEIMAKEKEEEVHPLLLPRENPFKNANNSLVSDLPAWKMILIVLAAASILLYLLSKT